MWSVRRHLLVRHCCRKRYHVCNYLQIRFEISYLEGLIFFHLPLYTHLHLGIHLCVYIQTECYSVNALFESTGFALVGSQRADQSARLSAASAQYLSRLHTLGNSNLVILEFFFFFFIHINLLHSQWRWTWNARVFTHSDSILSRASLWPSW